MTEIQKDNKNIANVPHRRKSNTPCLRFPGFTEEWEVKKFSEYIKLFRGSSPRPIVNFVTKDKNGVNWIKIGDTKNANNSIINNVEEKITIEGARKSRKVTSGELILANSMSFGKVYQLSIDGCIYDGWFVLREYENYFEKSFLLQLLNSDYLQKQYKRLSAGGIVQNISSEIVYETILIRPSFQEQQKIASFLSLIDERIQTQIKIIEELKLLKNTLSKKIFSRQLRFKDDNGNDFPEWQHKKLGELATITTGSSNREDSILDGEYTFFDRSQDVRTSKRYLFNKEAVIVPGEGQKFTPKYFMGKFDLHQRTYAIFDFIELSGKYLYYHIDIDEKYLQSQAVGSTVKSLRLPMFQSMPIKLPPLEEQMKIANFLLSIDTKIDVETELLEKLEKQKKYLLQNLFI